MIGSFLTRGLVMVFGYAYPAYECYKTVEKNKPEIEQLRFWCQYWILVACLTVFERVGDAFVSWVPMYSEAKLAFFIYLWYPKTMGTTYVYDSFFRPYVAKHENDIDRSLMELRTSAGDMVVIYWQRVASYGQTRIFDILQYIAAQSTPRPQPPQKRGPKVNQPSTSKPKQAPKMPQSASEEPPLPTSSSSSSEPEDEGEVTRKPSPLKPKTSTSEPAPDSQNSSNTQTIRKSVSAPIPIPTKSIPTTEAEPMEIEKAVGSPSQPDDKSKNENSNPKSSPLEETIMEETIRVTRGMLRKTRSAETR
ncbi:PREDICTED: HVA22-like protein i [Tarenaya hassleriana]|uniref:HVA22-like protein i n=1 Tax=Tarenaya hassleriana TaxID=28532 RepID=UPI00053C781A|nr:PREDICTED: HVA22-like protein i [Tarenaya hassleriana]